MTPRNVAADTRRGADPGGDAELNRALRRISIAALVMFLLLLINVNYLQGVEPSHLASEPVLGSTIPSDKYRVI